MKLHQKEYVTFVTDVIYPEKLKVLETDIDRFVGTLPL